MSNGPDLQPNLALQPQLVMWRATLDELPPVELPPGYTLRTYRDDRDAAAWERIVGGAFGWPEPAGTFDRTMRDDPAFRPERLFFVCRGDEPVAVAAAWHQPTYGEVVGYLHYVAKLPEETTPGLGCQVSLACLHQMAAEGRRSALLQTDDFRLAAVRIYVRLGFAPLLVHDNQRERWPAVFAALGHPEWAERYAAELAAPLFKPAE